MTNYVLIDFNLLLIYWLKSELRWPWRLNFTSDHQKTFSSDSLTPKIPLNGIICYFEVLQIFCNFNFTAYFFISSMGDPLISPLSFGLQVQSHSQAKSLPHCDQGTRDNKINPILFLDFWKKSRQFYKNGVMRMRKTWPKVAVCLQHKLTCLESCTRIAKPTIVQPTRGVGWEDMAMGHPLIIT